MRVKQAASSAKSVPSTRTSDTCPSSAHHQCTTNATSHTVALARRKSTQGQRDGRLFSRTSLHFPCHECCACVQWAQYKIGCLHGPFWIRTNHNYAATRSHDGSQRCILDNRSKYCCVKDACQFNHEGRVSQSASSTPLYPTRTQWHCVAPSSAR